MKTKSKGLTDKQRVRLKERLNCECSYIMENELLDQFLDMGTVMTLKRGQSVIEVGSVDDSLYIIMEGIMRVWYMDGDIEVTHSFGTPGCIAQSFHCYYKGLPSTENYEACCQVKLLKIDRLSFDRMVETNLSFARWNLRIAQCQMYHYEVKRRAINGTAAERYEKFIRHRPEIIRNVPLKIIASYLGITPEYLSKLRRQIQ